MSLLGLGFWETGNALGPYGSIFTSLGETSSPAHVLKTPGAVLGRGQGSELECFVLEGKPEEAAVFCGKGNMKISNAQVHRCVPCLWLHGLSCIFHP